jgi:hypothetical protein
VTAQPISEALGIAIIEQINRPVRLEVDQQRSVPALLAPKRNVVHAQDAWAALVGAVAHRMQNPQ